MDQIRACIRGIIGDIIDGGNRAIVNKSARLYR